MQHAGQAQDPLDVGTMACMTNPTASTQQDAPCPSARPQRKRGHGQRRDRQQYCGGGQVDGPPLGGRGRRAKHAGGSAERVVAAVGRIHKPEPPVTRLMAITPVGRRCRGPADGIRKAPLAGLVSGGFSGRWTIRRRFVDSRLSV